MNITKSKRMAAQILKVGENKIWLDPEQTEKITESMTKEDIRGLIGSGVIKVSKKAGHSRGRARILKAKKKAGRKRGYGKRKGRKKARIQKKATWVKNVRAQRKKLAELKKSGKKLKVPYSKAYKMVKGSYFRGKKYLDGFVEADAK